MTAFVLLRSFIFFQNVKHIFLFFQKQGSYFVLFHNCHLFTFAICSLLLYQHIYLEIYSVFVTLFVINCMLLYMNCMCNVEWNSFGATFFPPYDTNTVIAIFMGKNHRALVTYTSLLLLLLYSFFFNLNSFILL